MKEIYIRDNGTKGVRTRNTKPSRTQQQFKDEVDVNQIIKKYRKTGLITHLRNNPGVFADMANAPDYQQALDKVIKAQHTFDLLPADLRLRFSNDPQQFINFIADPKNDPEAIKLGLKLNNTPKTDPVVEQLQTLNKNISKQTKKTQSQSDDE